MKRHASIALLLAGTLIGCANDPGETRIDPEFEFYKHEFSCTPVEPELEPDCGSPLPSTFELSMTPRCEPSFIRGARVLSDADRLEMLAVFVSGGVVADQDVYERIVADVLAIRSLDPDLKNFVGYRPPYEDLWLRIEPEVFEQMERGEYDAWDCLNSLHKALAPIPLRQFTGVASTVIQYLGIYDMALLAEEYERLPGIIEAQPDYAIGDHGDVCVTPGETEWHYVFEHAGGDCPAGCTEHVYHHFVSIDIGDVRSAGQWDPSTGEPRPAWFDQYVTRDTCY